MSGHGLGYPSEPMLRRGVGLKAIGIMVGVGLYAASMGLAVLSATCMLWVSKLETRLPSR